MKEREGPRLQVVTLHAGDDGADKVARAAIRHGAGFLFRGEPEAEIAAPSGQGDGGGGERDTDPVLGVERIKRHVDVADRLGPDHKKPDGGRAETAG